MIKVFLTAVKYTPQVVMNYRQQSTAGFSIGAILLDLSGAMLSLMQLVLDSSSQGDWSGAVGNTAKLLLGNITVLFDLIFIFQHFILYRERSAENKPGLSEHDPLLDRSRNEA
jgi:cystinosin